MNTEEEGTPAKLKKRVLKRKAYDSDDDELDEEEEDESDEFKSHEVTPAMVKSHDIPSRSVSFEKIPEFNFKQTGTENSQFLYTPTQNSMSRTKDLSTSNSEESYIFSFHLDMENRKHLNGSLCDFQNFQTVYYLMYCAAFTSAKGHGEDISTHLLILKKDTKAESGDSYQTKLDDISYNSKQGCYLCEIHIHNDNALKSFSDALMAGKELFMVN